MCLASLLGKQLSYKRPIARAMVLQPNPTDVVGLVAHGNNECTVTLTESHHGFQQPVHVPDRGHQPTPPGTWRTGSRTAAEHAIGDYNKDLICTS